MRRALREGKRVRRTEKNEACGGRSGALLRRSQASGGTGITRDAAELDTAEMYRNTGWRLGGHRWNASASPGHPARVHGRLGDRGARHTPA